MAVVESKPATKGHTGGTVAPQEVVDIRSLIPKLGLRDRTQAQRFADAGRKLVTTQYRWEQCTSELIGQIHRRLDDEMPHAEPVHGETLQGEPELGVAAA